MKKAISILLVLVICLSMTVTAFAAKGDQQTGGEESGFVESPGEGGSSCDHQHTAGNQKKDPTCEEDGYEGREICEDCGEIIEPGKVIPSTGHKYDENGICTICQDVEDPKTGDISIALWVVLMVLAGAGLVVVTVVYRKKV